MFRYKSYKQSFIIAALVILLCLVCLTGATLALFSSDVKDGTIGIIASAGEVRVNIIDDTVEENSLVNESLAFRTTHEQPKILFEPGATFYTQGFKIKNEGTAPVQFTLSVSEDEKIDMEEFKKAFDVWIVRAKDPDFENADMITKFKGTLKAGDCSETYHLVIRMKETVGNEFQGKTYSGIGVTVYAVQGNAVMDTKE